MLLALVALGGAAAGLSCQPEAPPAAPSPAPARLAAGAQPDPLPPALRAALITARQREAGPEYRFASAGAAFTADNPEQEAALQLSTEGARLAVRGGALTLRLSEYGCEGATRALPPVSPRLGERSEERNRIELPRPELTEWYVNGPLGLEQGFTIPAAPAGGCGGQLLLGVTLRGASGLREERGAGAPFIALSVGGQRLAYSDLYAEDRSGRPLPAELRAEPDGAGERIVLRVDVRGAAFPVRIDPLVRVYEKQRLFSADPVDDRFGSAVAISGDLAVIGVPEADPRDRTRTGAAYVFTRTSFGNSWSYRHKLVAC